MIKKIGCLVIGLHIFVSPAQSETILQYFGTSWNEIAERMPELAESGWTALWLPPPFKAGSQFSVGFDTFDRFDLGSKNQMGGIATRYGTEDDLIRLIEIAHRFGIRVYFDNVMAHNGGPIPSYNDAVSVYAQPGFVPEDFHLIRSSGGFYRKPPTTDYSKEWDVLHRNDFGLDIAHEDPNASFGDYEGATFPKYRGIRHPDNPEYYLDTDIPIGTNGDGETIYTFANNEPYEDVGYSSNNIGANNNRFDWDDINENGQHDIGEDSEPFTDSGLNANRPEWQSITYGMGDGIYNMGNPIIEDVNTLLFRAIRWFMDEAYVDGFRLDAVKHVPYYFFGKTYEPKDSSNWGYNGQIQEQFNITRGFSDWDNHRDSVFNLNQGRDDAMLFGEHLGNPPPQEDYVKSGMRMADNAYMNSVDYAVSTNGSLWGHDQPGYSTYGVNEAVIFTGSHDYNSMNLSNRPSAHSLLLTRVGLPIVYTDGYNETLYPDAAGKFFPQHGDNAFLGQFGDDHLLNLLYINQLFSRGDQISKWSDDEYVAYERLDWRETDNLSGAAILSYILSRNGSNEQSRSWPTSFPEGARLFNYSTSESNIYVNVVGGELKNDNGANPIISAGEYAAFSWRVPKIPDLWDNGILSEKKPIEILQDGEPATNMLHIRKDGRSGDPDFNPYNIPNDPTNDFQYALSIPRITSGSNLTFIATSDGSAENIHIKLDGGIDMNSQNGLGSQSGDLRDNPPALSYDMDVGYEQMHTTFRVAEKFASTNSGTVGSLNAAQYNVTIGASNELNHTYIPENYLESNTSSIDSIAHESSDFIITSSNIIIQAIIESAVAKTNQFVFLYYTLNSTNAPNGCFGNAKENTIIENFINISSNIWQATLPLLPENTLISYKIGASYPNENSVFPFDQQDIELIPHMETRSIISNFNAETITFYPHNDYGIQKTGLAEGFHILRLKPMLNRQNAATIYNLHSQTFYYDTQRPEGEIIYPANDVDALNDSSYEFVIRTDSSVQEVQFNIIDNDDQNNDSSTGAEQGNGTNSWVNAVEVDSRPFITSSFEKEWRFDYVNIPSSGEALIKIRLKEASSSTNNLLDDIDGHFTTLERTIDTRGPGMHFFVAYPQNDLEYIGSDYVTKIHFSKTLAAGLTSNELLNCIGITINSNTQARTNYSVNFNISESYHEIAFEMDDYFNEMPSEYHTIEAQFNRDSYPELIAKRVFYAIPIDKPFINIANPPLVNTNGEPYVITFPDKANPGWLDRKFTIEVDTTIDADDIDIQINPNIGDLSEARGNPDVYVNPGYKRWRYVWQFSTNMPADQIESTYIINAIANLPSDETVSTIRNTKIVFRELIDPALGIDLDSDDDGIPDTNELTEEQLPTSIPVTEWTNSDVHESIIFGLTTTNSPDSDGDGLPDGLELGLRIPLNATETSTTNDTDGDGYYNFISDLDPPFYNTYDNFNLVPSISTYSEGDKSVLKAGSTTDPNNRDSDFDGLSDGIEDANRNGWVDGDGESLAAATPPSLERIWPDESLDVNDIWIETDPNNPDTDGDNLSDGFGEDKNFDGFIEGDENIDREYTDNEAWMETDPLNNDTDGDGLPDGWEIIYNLNPLDNGLNNLSSTNVLDGNVDFGPDGDPDNDGLSNLIELLNGTDPNKISTESTTSTPSIVIGKKSPIIFGVATNEQEFTDWNIQDLIAIDNYDDLEESSNGGDIYYLPSKSDGLESSRDLIAFYARDGGSITNNGDDLIYFRVDVLDLVEFAEDSGLNTYVVIDTGNPDVGEKKIVDNIDVLTEMRWEVIVALYDDTNGSVFINKPGSINSDTLDDTIIYGIDDVEIRNQADNNGFKESYFSSKLDSIEFSIHRNALLDSGWDGNFNQLNFQVFTTRDGTNEGDGELDGPDIQDAIKNQFITEDFAGITKGDVERQRYDGRLALEALTDWVGISTNNDQGIQIKIIPLLHGNQHIEPGNMIQNLINNGYGTGFYRTLDTHEAFSVPLSLHITPTLASAIQWAKADPSQGPLWRDGPMLNQRIQNLISADIIDLTASTFSDHLMPYFNQSFNNDNISLATTFLNSIYGSNSVSEKVFWTPERLIDDDVLLQLQALGFEYTFIDQSQHLYRWFGIDEVTGDNAHRINLINNIKCIPISDRQNQYRFQSHDGGPALDFRKTLSRRLQSGIWDGQYPQVITLQMNWQDFENISNANSYDRLIQWLSNKSWIKIITPEQIVNNEIDISIPSDQSGDIWKVVERGSNLNLEKTGHDWIQYSSQENYDNWYMGSDLNQGLNNIQFEIIPGVSSPTTYGSIDSGGILNSAWSSVSQLENADDTLAQLARATLHASVFETAFHEQTSADLTKFSSGEFVYPDTSYNELAGFSKSAQSQTRMATVYNKIKAWTDDPPINAVTEIVDIDLDGINEYLLFNNKIFAIHEQIGGKIIAIWARIPETREVFQMTGNMTGYSGSENEIEGFSNIYTNGNINSYRTSCLKDWYTWDGSTGTNKYVNDIYTIEETTDPAGWIITSSDSKIIKSVTLDYDDVAFNVSYQLSNDIPSLYIRNGLSPNLLDLLKYGQENLSELSLNGSTISLANTNSDCPVTAAIQFGTNVYYSSFATDDAADIGYDFYTFNMRNQAQTHQIELYGMGNFSFRLGFGINDVDSDNDNMPDDFELQFSFLNPLSSIDRNNDEDLDNISNVDEFIAGTDLNDALDFFSISSIISDISGINIKFPSKDGRKYYVWEKDRLNSSSNIWELTSSSPLIGNDTELIWSDDDQTLRQKFYKVEIEYP